VASSVAHEARAWLEENWSDDLTLREWWNRLAGDGWAFPSWPPGHGGRGLAGDDARDVSQAIAAAGAVGPPGGLGQMMGGPVIIEHGTDEQRARWLFPLASGLESWCQLFSEPGAGSDLASLQTRAVRDGDVWIVNGQKVWTSGARTADRGMLVARTDPDAPKHKGITYFIIDMEQPGIEVRPLRQMDGGSTFNEVFFSDAVVPHADLVGSPSNGWVVAVSTLAYERQGLGGGGVPRMLPVGAPGERNGSLDRKLSELIAEAADRRGEQAAMMASQSFSAATSSAAPSRPAATSSPSAAAGTSSMKLRPARMAATRCGSRSAPITLAPDSAKATASGRPT